MLELALWLKEHGFRADQVQAFLPSPMATATAMYHSGKNPLRRVGRDTEDVHIPKGLRVRRLHKAFLRYHDPHNWPMLRAALKRMGRADLIGSGAGKLVPPWQPAGTGIDAEGRRRPGTAALTQHTGLPRTPAERETRETRARPGRQPREAMTRLPDAHRPRSRGIPQAAMNTGSAAATSDLRAACDLQT
jgi:hypothetical protein